MLIRKHIKARYANITQCVQVWGFTQYCRIIYLSGAFRFRSHWESHFISYFRALSPNNIVLVCTFTFNNMTWIKLFVQ